jgi:hypothetical protein
MVQASGEERQGVPAVADWSQSSDGVVRRRWTAKRCPHRNVQQCTA